MRLLSLPHLHAVAPFLLDVPPVSYSIGVQRHGQNSRGRRAVARRPLPLSIRSLA